MTRPGATRRPAAAGTAAPAVLVLDTGYRAGPWACRSLAEAGFRVVGAHVAGLGAGGRSRWCPRPVPVPSPRTHPHAYVEAVAETCASEAVDVVLPVSEDATRVIAGAAADIEVAVAGPTAAQYALLCDKGALAETCAHVGVDHPATAALEPGDPAPGWPDLPAIVKPRLSGEALQGSDAAVVVRTRAQRAAAVERLLASGLGAVVQEVVAGRPWVVHAVRDGGGAFAMAAARVETTYPRGAGTSSRSRVVAAPAALRSGTRRLLDAVDYRGPCCLNLIERGGRFWLHDVNLRLAASVGAAVAAGFDQPRLGVRAALGLPWIEALPGGRGVLYVRLDGELRGLAGELRRGGLAAAAATLAGLARGAASHRALLDPSPADHFFLWGSAQRALVARARRAAALL